MRPNPPPIRADELAARLRSHRPRRLWGARRMAHAAVAIIVRPGTCDADGVEVLFIRRGERAGDPWSGNMAFPGGRAEAGDTDPLATALRETREEIGVDLGACADLAGPLSPILAMTHDRRRPMALWPYAFVAQTRDLVLALDPSEVAEAVWIPLVALAGPGHRVRHAHRVLGLPWTWPAWRWQGRVIWGLTHRITRELLRVSARSQDARRSPPERR